MSIFSKAASQVGTADLQELLQESAVENARLEFKLQVSSKDDTLKKLSSFANTFGGYMVVGAKANSADGRIEDLPGVDEEAGYKQKVVDWCFKHVSPPLIVEVSDPISVPGTSGKICYVVYTPESDVAPHFLNGRKGIWVRTDEFSARFEAQLANENELRHLFDRRRLIRERRANLLERARKRFDTYAAKIHTDRGGHRTETGSLLEFFVVPRFPARPLCDQAQLKPLLMRRYESVRGVLFPRPDGGVISQHESAIVLGAMGRVLSMFEVNVWGMLFYGTRIDDNLSGTRGIHLYGFVGETLLFLRHAGKIIQALGYSGPIHVQMKITKIRDVPWLYGTQNIAGIFSEKGSVLDDDCEFAISTTCEILREKTDGIVMDLLRYVFFSVNWPDLIDSQTKLEELLRMGYQYNSWPVPQSFPS
jgi:Putative DNA-binding domain